ncbi:TPA: hypothetical protein ACTL3H_004738 [Escherichia coli]
MEATILGGWPLKILTAFSQLKLMKKMLLIVELKSLEMLCP